MKYIAISTHKVVFGTVSILNISAERNDLIRNQELVSYGLAIPLDIIIMVNLI